MNKITKRALCVACAIAVSCGGSAYLTKRFKKDAVPTMAGVSKETPVIVLDAGHGECS